MRVFVAGATGAIGRPLVRRLLAEGHEVTGMTRSEARADELRAAGAGAAVADALDPQAVLDAVVGARPEVVVHQLTDIPQKLDFRHYAEQMAGNDRVREEGTRHLLSSALAAGARRVVAQSISFAYQPDGDWVKTEDAPLWLDAPEEFRRTVKVLDGLERSVTQTEGIDGVVLRYGFFYGPGTSYAADGHLAEEIRRRRLPLVGRGTGMSSFIHVDDAAEATALALERVSGILNVVDDDPAPASDALRWMRGEDRDC